VASSPGRLERSSAALRAGGLALAGLLSLTNATFAVLLQSAVSVAAIALVIARAVNTLG
jgi:hypothetical protein